MRTTATFLSILICSVFLYSCASETEQNGLNKIVELYGGNATITKGVAASTENGSGKYIELTLDNPSVMETDADNTGPILLNAIYTLYANQTPEERATYSRYDGELKYGDKSFTLKTSDSLLKKIDQNVEAVINTSKMISENDFEKATAYFHPLLKEMAPADTMRAIMKGATDSLQTVNDTFLAGIFINTDIIEQISPDKKDYFIYTVKQLCQNGERFFYYRVYPNPTSDKNIIYIKSTYKLK